MPTIKLSFPGGRYHATPWGHHVNEGQIEWPPSPWRLLRALIAVGYATLQWKEVPEVGRRLIEQLAAVLPEYRIPSASSAHSRHYMPVGKLKSNKLEDTTLVFDTWANVGDGQLVIHWDCDLSHDCLLLFSDLISKLGYLGRSESWVEATIVHDKGELSSMAKSQRRAYPHRDGECPGAGWEQIHLMAATTPESYAKWRNDQVELRLIEHPLPEGTKPTKGLLKQRQAAIAPYPSDLIDCLQKDTSWWKGLHKWSQPPGSQRVLYWRPTDALTVSHPKISRSIDATPIRVMLLALSTSSRNSAALPSVTRTLPQAELFHRAIVGRVGKGQRVHCPELTGRDETGRPLRDNHKHAHILPLDLDENGQLDHLMVWAPMGLGGAAQEAIRNLKSTWTKKGDDLQVSLVGRGDLADLRRLPDALSQTIEKLLGPIEGSTAWIGLTPFVPPRFRKKSGKDTIEGQVAAELEHRYGAKVTSVRVIRPGDQVSAKARANDTMIASKFRHYVRSRSHGGQRPPSEAGYLIAFELATPIHGPVCLGYGSHFGLGLFGTE